MTPRLRLIVVTMLTALVVVLGWLGYAAGSSLARTVRGVAPIAAATPAPVVVPPSPAAPRRVLALIGDSLMYGGDLADSASPPAAITQARPQLDVFNLATGGTAVADELTRLRPIQLLRPDLLVVWLGSVEIAAPVPASTYQSGLDQLITRLPAVPLVLVTPLGAVDTPAATVAVYAAAVRAEAAAHHLPLVDLAGHIVARDYGPDGVHLTAVACARVGLMIAAALPAA